ncbi:MAG: hypothetical protein JXM75_06865 [Chromatiaceae bacterium]|nr:hypothetical protein [Chromatiaceae bacterium]
MADEGLPGSALGALFVQEHTTAAEFLTPFATAFRYPGDALDPDPDDVAKAIALAETVLNFVLTRMPETVRKRSLDGFASS